MPPTTFPLRWGADTHEQADEQHHRRQRFSSAPVDDKDEQKRGLSDKSATLALQNGVPTKVVSERLGRYSAGFTMDTYQHVLPGMQEEAANAVAAAIFGD